MTMKRPIQSGSVRRLVLRRGSSGFGRRLSSRPRFGTFESTATIPAEDMNAMQWLELCCPEQVLPKVLAFAGPQMTSTLAKTNRHWKELADNDATWKVLCSELYKWNEGDPEPSTSWKDFYRSSPCVPVDYPTIPAALSVAGDFQSGRSMRAHHLKQHRSIRVLLRPGTHVLNESIVIQAAENVDVSLETVRLPDNVYYAEPQPSSDQKRTKGLGSTHPSLWNSSSLSPSKPSRGRPFSGLLRCSRHGDVVADDTEQASESSGDDWVFDPSLTPSCAGSQSVTVPKAPTRAILALNPNCRRHNEPVLMVRRGAVSLKDVDIEHSCLGHDIWQGQAAVHLQPFFTESGVLLPRPSVSLVGVKVTSLTGRGIVCIDGGSVRVSGCAIHDCAATGIYVGGPGSQAIVERTDVVRNGLGNRSGLRGRGVVRGHSGIYLEQGVVELTRSNISDNSLTGISAVSHDNAVLRMVYSHLGGNGTVQLEMPPPHSPAGRRSMLSNNTFGSSDDEEEDEGQPRSRMQSGLLPEPAVPSNEY